jgi:hypothetical protein
MHTLSRKVLTLAGLVLLSAPAFASETLPLGIKPDQVDVAQVEASSSQPETLVGRYTFLATGAYVGSTFLSRKSTTVGSLLFDGKGNYTGIFDTDEERGIILAAPVTGTYTLGANGVGTLSFTALGLTFQFSIYASATSGTVQNATLMETDDIVGGIGYLKKQTIPTSLGGSFSFDLNGETVVTNGVPDAVTLGGTFTIAQGEFQGTATLFVNEGSAGTGTVTPNVSLPGIVTALDANGRFVITTVFPGGTPTFSGGTPIHFIGYTIDATHLYLMAIDPPSGIAPLLSGSAIH